MQDFLRFYDEITNDYQWSLKIYHSSIMDWRITIGYKMTHPKHGEIIIDVQDCDMQLVFAKAHVALKGWLRENKGGY
ncbi:hypothetical protein ACFVS2_20560 [Brevibacillus sp. NPDC058079]|uniref:hypothetical protein n=1 Tax=Brevibacillus sp. NPDC058079 TaxID=3346330 RepID=UPI0036EACF45